MNQPPPFKPSKKCPFCAEQIAVGAIKCKHCQSMLSRETAKRSGKLLLVAFILLVFLGWLGAHAFYAGKILQGFVFPVLSVLSVLTFGSLFFLIVVVPIVLWIGDFFRIVNGSYTDSDGKKITQWT